MPVKKQTKQKVQASSSNKDETSNQVQTTTLSEPVQTITESFTLPLQTQTFQSENTDKEKKAGRTLLVKSLSGNQINSSVFNSFEGLTNTSETKTSNSYFLTFDTVQHATTAYQKLCTESDYRVKYSYYRIFFTMNGLTDTTDYNQIKKEFTEYITKNTSNSTNTNSITSVLYCKFYRKESSYIGCGDFTIDTLNGMTMLLSKETGLKDFSFGSYSGTFFRFNGKKDKSTHNNMTEHN